VGILWRVSVVTMCNPNCLFINLFFYLSTLSVFKQLLLSQVLFLKVGVAFLAVMMFLILFTWVSKTGITKALPSFRGHHGCYLFPFFIPSFLPSFILTSISFLSSFLPFFLTFSFFPSESAGAPPDPFSSRLKGLSFVVSFQALYGDDIVQLIESQAGE
jgi:hypothetical protein